MGNRRSKPHSLPSLLCPDKVILLWVAQQGRLPLSKNVLQAVSEYLANNPILIDVQCAEMLRFDPRLLEWVSMFPLSVPLPRYSYGHALAVLRDGTIFVCGAGATAHLIKGGVVEALPLMLVGRYHHCAVQPAEATCVCVFGGSDVGNDYCNERFNLKTHQWERLGKQMRPRSKINACEYKGLLYFCGGDQEGTIETYDWKEGVSALLDFLISVGSKTPCITVILDDRCLTISNAATVHWHLRDRKEKVVLHESYELKSVSTPLVYQNCVYVVSESECYAFALDSGLKVCRYPKLGEAG